MSNFPSELFNKFVGCDPATEILINYLGIVNSSKIFSLLNKTCRLLFKNNYIIFKNIVDAKLSIRSAILYFNIMERARRLNMSSDLEIEQRTGLEKILKENWTFDLPEHNYQTLLGELTRLIFVNWIRFPSFSPYK